MALILAIHLESVAGRLVLMCWIWFGHSQAYQVIPAIPLKTRVNPLLCLKTLVASGAPEMAYHHDNDQTWVLMGEKQLGDTSV